MVGPQERYRIRQVTVEGFKSLRDPIAVDFGDLTLLAGANSSGKSSLMQPLLLLKQSLEARYDPGRLLLEGPNVSLGTARETLWRNTDTFSVRLETSEGLSGQMTFRRDKEGLSFLSVESQWGYKRHTVALRPKMGPEEVQKAKSDLLRFVEGWLGVKVEIAEGVEILPAVSYGFLLLSVGSSGWIPVWPWAIFGEIARRLIHVPALRGNPLRKYPYTVPRPPYFPGLFQDYTAGMITQWQEGKLGELKALWDDLRHLELTGKVQARRITDSEVELLVGRTVVSQDVVNIADVGFGISQVLPVLVALRAAQPGQIVYTEQPEIHLHPNAQVKLADLLVQAAQRGVQVVVETHSELILLGIQKAIAEGKLRPEAVKLHWFERDEEGVTRVHTAELDEEGTFGNWPVDFSDVAMDAMDAYLDAVAQRRSQQQ